MGNSIISLLLGSVEVKTFKIWFGKEATWVRKCINYLQEENHSLDKISGLF